MSSYGFIRVPRDLKQAIPNAKSPSPQGVVELPSSELAQSILTYARRELPPKVLNHSLRVYQYSVAIMKDHFNLWDLDPEVVFVTALLHDIGTTDKNMRATKLSFEFYGAAVAQDLVLQCSNKNQDYAEAVAEAIIRHQDLGSTGYITSLGLIIQISTILDNVGGNLEYVDPHTLDAVNREYPRDGWLGCFADAIDRENETKPWCHTSQLGVEEFRDNVLANKLQYKI